MARSKDPNRPLSAKCLAFVAAILGDPKRDQTRAALAAGYAPRSAHVIGSQLMTDPRVKALVGEKFKEDLSYLGVTPGDVIADVAHVMKADPNELTEYRVGCCRYCWGEGNQYQRTPQEYRDALIAYRKSDEGKADPLGLRFDHAGGVGYRRRRDANPDCPECDGEGAGRTVIKDTRHLSASAKVLYNGVKETRHGVEVGMRSKDSARDLAARHLGMVRTAHEVTGPGGGPVQHGGVVASVQLTTSDPLEASREYQKLMGGA